MIAARFSLAHVDEVDDDDDEDDDDEDDEDTADDEMEWMGSLLGTTMD